MNARLETIGQLSGLVMDRVACGFSMRDALESIKSGRASVSEDVWRSVERRCTNLCTTVLSEGG